MEVLLADQNLTRLYVHDMLDRQASHGQLRALWSQLQESLKCDMEKFRPPDGVTLRRCLHDEERITLASGDVVMRSTVTGEIHTVVTSEHLQHSFSIMSHVTDRGSVVCSSLHFLMAMGYLMFAFFGFFHGQWNALKTAARKSQGGKFWRAIIRYMVVWNMNAGPFRSRQWFRAKQEALRRLLSSMTVDSPEFQAIVHEFANDNSLPSQTREEQEIVFKRLASMRSFIKVGPILKLMRWCSITQVRNFYRNELHGLKMVLKHMSGDEGAAVAEVVLQTVAAGTSEAAHSAVEKSLRSKCGTIHLAPAYITDTNTDAIDVFVLATAAEQALYAHRATNVKDAKTAFQWNLEHTAHGKWEDIFINTARGSLYNMKELADMHCVDKGLRSSSQAAGLMDLVPWVCKCRAETVIPDAFAHPHCSIGSIDPDLVFKEQSRKSMAQELRILLQAEGLSHSHGELRSLLNDIPWAHWKAIRLYLELNSLQFSLGLGNERTELDEVLENIHYRLGDEKGSEDMHQFCRDETRRRRFAHLSAGRIMRCCVQSDVPRKRGFRTLNVPSEVAASARRSVANRSLHRVFKGAPTAWHSRLNGILEPNRTWPSPTVRGYEIGCSAWMWLLAYFRRHIGSMPLTAAWLSKLATERALLRGVCGNEFIVVASVKWHVLIWRVDSLAPMLWKLALERGSIQVLHITKAADWAQAEGRGVFLEHVGVAFEQQNDWRPMLELSLLKGVPLDVRELRLLSAELGLEVELGWGQDMLLAGILESVFKGNPEDLEKAKIACQKANTPKGDEEEVDPLLASA
jgi:hypothetical protein